MNGEGLSFDWDEGNRRHVAQHGVTPDEAEEALRRHPLDIELQIEDEGDGEERLLLLGETSSGRILQIVTTWREGKVRVISAWDAPKQLRTYYLDEMRRRYGHGENSEV
jgi:uncharacterized protein